ncbi:MAG: regulatory protein RecX [Actinomycetota bacterium]
MARRKADDGEVSESAVREIVLRRLSHAPRTRSELARDLARRGVPDEVSTSVLDGLQECGLIDDDQFAHLWVESRHRGRGLARGALRRELADRGVSPEIVSAALEQIDSESEITRAHVLAERRLRTMTGCDRPTRQRRLSGYLARRGYSGSVIATVLSDVLGEGHVDTVV